MRKETTNNLSSVYGKVHGLRLWEVDDLLTEIGIAGQYIFVSREDPGLRHLRMGKGNTEKYVVFWDNNGRILILAVFKNFTTEEVRIFNEFLSKGVTSLTEFVLKAYAVNKDTPEYLADVHPHTFF